MQANDTSEWMWFIYFKYAAAIIIIQFNLALISVLNCYVNQGYFDIDHAYQATRMVYEIYVKRFIL